MAEQDSIAQPMSHIFIHSSLSGHLGLCRVLPAVNSGAMGMVHE